MFTNNGQIICITLNIAIFAIVFMSINAEALIAVERIPSEPDPSQGNFAFAKFFAFEDNNSVRGFRPMDKRQSKQSTQKEVQMRDGNNENGFAFAFAKRRNVEKFAKIKRGEIKAESPFAVEFIEVVPNNMADGGVTGSRFARHAELNSFARR
ncbi:hypothetical protein ACQ4LE_001295 [Meloidogyne hapla]|uniref:Uncharacterized protein n=1 Tax=Meloidogyne hapla TaxID=6305 RepID=A0A1I8B6L5_MELHA